MQRSIKITAIAIILGIIFVVGYVRFLEYTMAFHPTADVHTTPDVIGLPFEDIYFSPVDDASIKLNGWFIKSPQAKSTLIFLHGNAGNISDRLEKIVFFHQLGMNVFILDYRGYGKSTGRPTEAGLYEDAKAAFDYLFYRQDLAGTKFVAYGASLGGVVAVHLATIKPLQGMILDSTFTSARDMGRAIFPIVPTFLLSFKMDSLSKIRQITIPKLFLHSLEDEVVPFRLGKKLYEAALNPKEFAQMGGSHNDTQLDPNGIFTQRVSEFLKKWKFI